MDSKALFLGGVCNFDALFIKNFPKSSYLYKI